MDSNFLDGSIVGSLEAHSILVSETLLKQKRSLTTNELPLNQQFCLSPNVIDIDYENQSYCNFGWRKHEQKLQHFEEISQYEIINTICDLFKTKTDDYKDIRQFFEDEISIQLKDEEDQSAQRDISINKCIKLVINSEAPDNDSLPQYSDVFPVISSSKQISNESFATKLELVKNSFTAPYPQIAISFNSQLHSSHQSLPCVSPKAYSSMYFNPNELPAILRVMRLLSLIGIYSETNKKKTETDKPQTLFRTILHPYLALFFSFSTVSEGSYFNPSTLKQLKNMKDQSKWPSDFISRLLSYSKLSEPHLARLLHAIRANASQQLLSARGLKLDFEIEEDLSILKSTMSRLNNSNFDSNGNDNEGGNGFDNNAELPPKTILSTNINEPASLSNTNIHYQEVINENKSITQFNTISTTAASAVSPLPYHFPFNDNLKHPEPSFIQPLVNRPDEYNSIEVKQTNWAKTSAFSNVLSTESSCSLFLRHSSKIPHPATFNSSSSRSFADLQTAIHSIIRAHSPILNNLNSQCMSLSELRSEQSFYEDGACANPTLFFHASDSYLSPSFLNRTGVSSQISPESTTEVVSREPFNETMDVDKFLKLMYRKEAVRYSLYFNWLASRSYDGQLTKEEMEIKSKFLEKPEQESFCHLPASPDYLYFVLLDKYTVHDAISHKILPLPLGATDHHMSSRILELSSASKSDLDIISGVTTVPDVVAVNDSSFIVSSHLCNKDIFKKRFHEDHDSLISMKSHIVTRNDPVVEGVRDEMKFVRKAVEHCVSSFLNYNPKSYNAKKSTNLNEFVKLYKRLLTSQKDAETAAHDSQADPKFRSISAFFGQMEVVKDSSLPIEDVSEPSMVIRSLGYLAACLVGAVRMPTEETPRINYIVGDIINCAKEFNNSNRPSHPFNGINNDEEDRSWWWQGFERNKLPINEVGTTKCKKSTSSSSSSSSDDDDECDEGLGDDFIDFEGVDEQNSFMKRPFKREEPSTDKYDLGGYLSISSSITFDSERKLEREFMIQLWRDHFSLDDLTHDFSQLRVGEFFFRLPPDISMLTPSRLSLFNYVRRGFSSGPPGQLGVHLLRKMALDLQEEEQKRKITKDQVLTPTEVVDWFCDRFLLPRLSLDAKISSFPFCNLSLFGLPFEVDKSIDLLGSLIEGFKPYWCSSTGLIPKSAVKEDFKALQLLNTKKKMKFKSLCDLYNFKIKKKVIAIKKFITDSRFVPMEFKEHSKRNFTKIGERNLFSLLSGSHWLHKRCIEFATGVSTTLCGFQLIVSYEHNREFNWVRNFIKVLQYFVSHSLTDAKLLCLELPPYEIIRLDDPISADVDHLKDMLKLIQRDCQVAVIPMRTDPSLLVDARLQTIGASMEKRVENSHRIKSFIIFSPDIRRLNAGVASCLSISGMIHKLRSDKAALPYPMRCTFKFPPHSNNYIGSFFINSMNQNEKWTQVIPLFYTSEKKMDGTVIRQNFPLKAFITSSNIMKPFSSNNPQNRVLDIKNISAIVKLWYNFTERFANNIFSTECNSFGLFQSPAAKVFEVMGVRAALSVSKYETPKPKNSSMAAGCVSSGSNSKYLFYLTLQGVTKPLTDYTITSTTSMCLAMLNTCAVVPSSNLATECESFPSLQWSSSCPFECKDNTRIYHPTNPKFYKDIPIEHAVSGAKIVYVSSAFARKVLFSHELDNQLYMTRNNLWNAWINIGRDFPFSIHRSAFNKVNSSSSDKNSSEDVYSMMSNNEESYYTSNMDSTLPIDTADDWKRLKSKTQLSINTLLQLILKIDSEPLPSFTTSSNFGYAYGRQLLGGLSDDYFLENSTIFDKIDDEEVIDYCALLTSEILEALLARDFLENSDSLVNNQTLDDKFAQFQINLSLHQNNKAKLESSLGLLSTTPYFKLIPNDIEAVVRALRKRVEKSISSSDKHLIMLEFLRLQRRRHWLRHIVTLLLYVAVDLSKNDLFVLKKIKFYAKEYFGLTAVINLIDRFADATMDSNTVADFSTINLPNNIDFALNSLSKILFIIGDFETRIFTTLQREISSSDSLHLLSKPSHIIQNIEANTNTFIVQGSFPCSLSWKVRISGVTAGILHYTKECLEKFSSSIKDDGELTREKAKKYSRRICGRVQTEDNSNEDIEADFDRFTFMFGPLVASTCFEVLMDCFDQYQQDTMNNKTAEDDPSSTLKGWTTKLMSFTRSCAAEFESEIQGGTTSVVIFGKDEIVRSLAALAILSLENEFMMFRSSYTAANFTGDRSFIHLKDSIDGLFSQSNNEEKIRMQFLKKLSPDLDSTTDIDFKPFGLSDISSYDNTVSDGLTSLFPSQYRGGLNTKNGTNELKMVSSHYDLKNVHFLNLLFSAAKRCHSHSLLSTAEKTILMFSDQQDKLNHKHALGLEILPISEQVRCALEFPEITGSCGVSDLRQKSTLRASIIRYLHLFPNCVSSQSSKCVPYIYQLMKSVESFRSILSVASGCFITFVSRRSEVRAYDNIAIHKKKITTEEVTQIEKRDKKEAVTSESLLNIKKENNEHLLVFGGSDLSKKRLRILFTLWYLSFSHNGGLSYALQCDKSNEIQELLAKNDLWTKCISFPKCLLLRASAPLDISLKFLNGSCGLIPKNLFPILRKNRVFPIIEESADCSRYVSIILIGKLKAEVDIAALHFGSYIVSNAIQVQNSMLNSHTKGVIDESCLPISINLEI